MRTILALCESVVKLSNASWQVVLDCAWETEAQKLAQYGSASASTFQKSEPFFLVLEGRRGDFLRSGFNRLVEDRWYRLSLGTSGLSGGLHRDPVSDPSDEFVIKTAEEISTTAVGRALQSELRLKFARDGWPAPEYANEATSFAVYNVGQGSCSGLCGASGAPLVYFDFGGGAVWNAKTFPAETRFCFRSQPSIVLSHWDVDHWSSFYREPASHNAMWYAPRQSVGFAASKVAAELAANGRLLLMPSATWGSGSVSALSCTGTNRNDSGLSVRIELSVGGGREVALLPGDAAYRFVPVNHKANVDRLVATHHGGRWGTGTTIPPATGATPLLAYSAGSGNTYKHPLGRSRAAHVSVGWHSALETAHAGHIDLVGYRPRPLGGCGCTLH